MPWSSRSQLIHLRKYRLPERCIRCCHIFFKQTSHGFPPLSSCSSKPSSQKPGSACTQEIWLKQNQILSQKKPKKSHTHTNKQTNKQMKWGQTCATHLGWEYHDNKEPSSLLPTATCSFPPILQRDIHTHKYTHKTRFLFFLPHADFLFSTRSSQGHKILQRTQAKSLEACKHTRKANGKGLINCLQARRSGWASSSENECWGISSFRNGVIDLPIHHPSTSTYLCPARYTRWFPFASRTMYSASSTENECWAFLPSAFVPTFQLIIHPHPRTPMSGPVQ
jgi:hypothetical protein